MICVIICYSFPVILLHVKNVLVHLVAIHTDIEIQRQKFPFAVSSATRQFMQRFMVVIPVASVWSNLFCSMMAVFLLHSCLVLCTLCDEFLVITMITYDRRGAVEVLYHRAKLDSIIWKSAFLPFFWSL